MDRLYRQAKSHLAATPSAGQFASAEIDFTSVTINDGNTISISWNSVSRTYTFKDAPNGITRESFNPPVSTESQIGATAEQTADNLAATINSNVHTVALGQDTTISASASGAKLLLFSNAKIASSFSLGGTNSLSLSNSVAGLATTNVFPDAPWTGLSCAGGSATLLVRNEESEAYNAGPPVNGLKTITVNLPSNTIIPIEVWGCSIDCTTYK